MKSLLLAVIGVVFLGASSFAGEPTIQLKKRIDTIQKVLLDKSNRHNNRVKVDVVEKLRSVLAEFFSWEEMSRRAVGYKSKKWVGVPKVQRDAYVKAFQDLLEETYIGRLDEYSGQEFVFPAGGERIYSKGRKAEVKTLFKLDDKDIPVVYRLFLRKGIWWVYDIKIEEVSMVMNYKNQFEPILQDGGIAEVTRRLVSKMKKVKAAKENK